VLLEKFGFGWKSRRERNETKIQDDLFKKERALLYPKNNSTNKAHRTMNIQEVNSLRPAESIQRNGTCFIVLCISMHNVMRTCPHTCRLDIPTVACLGLWWTRGINFQRATAPGMLNWQCPIQGLFFTYLNLNRNLARSVTRTRYWRVRATHSSRGLKFHFFWLAGKVPQGWDVTQQRCDHVAAAAQMMLRQSYGNSGKLRQQQR
jgi:hypothetical protein